MAQFRLANDTAIRKNIGMFKNLLITALTAAVLPAFAAEWMTDLDAAKTKAAAENKAVLIDFTGSDWCGYCIKLKKEVFDTPAFEQYAADKFVLVEIDVPNDVKRVGGIEQLRKNQALCQEFNVSGFPTIMVLNPTGTVLGGFVGGKPNLAAVQEPLNIALESNRKLNEAEKLQGLEKAALLMEVYSALPSDMQGGALELQKQIAELDPENKIGGQTLLHEMAVMQQVEAQLINCGRDIEKALAIVNAAIPTVSGANQETLIQVKLSIMQAKIDAAFRTAETVEDVNNIRNLMLECVDCIPSSEQQAAKAIIEKRFSDPEALLQQIKAARK